MSKSPSIRSGGQGKRVLKFLAASRLGEEAGEVGSGGGRSWGGGAGSLGQVKVPTPLNRREGVGEGAVRRRYNGDEGRNSDMF